MNGCTSTARGVTPSSSAPALALADNPSLTARFDGTLREQQQPRRVVIGQRNLEDAGAASSHLRELGYDQFANIDDALISLYEAGARDVLVEGGAGLASAFLNAGYVDAVQAYIAPLLLGEGGECWPIRWPKPCRMRVVSARGHHCAGRRCAHRVRAQAIRG